MRPLLKTLILASLCSACSQPKDEDNAARSAPEFSTGTYSGRTYKLYVPGGYHQGSAVPLMLMLHGCLQDPDSFAQVTRMNQLAERETFIVVYPQQDTSVNGAKCWQFWDGASQTRGGGEPALFMGMLNAVTSRYTVNPSRVYAAGFSSGAGSMSLVGALYPDVFAAIAVHSGLEFKAATTVSESFAAMRSGGPDPNRQGLLAYQAMGPRLRTMPTIVFHGTTDGIVNRVNGDQVLTQWAQTNDLADDAADNGTVSDTPSSTEMGQVPGGRSFVHTTHRDKAGQVLLERYLVTGMDHAWSGGASGSYSDGKGPDATGLIWAFFQSHPLGGGTGPDGGTTDGGRDGGSDGGGSDGGRDGGSDGGGSDGGRDGGSDGGGTDGGGSDGGGSTTPFASIGAEDGYAGALLIDGASAAVHQVGDRGMFNRDTYRLILSFDTSTLPAGATIKAARLRITRRSLQGTVSSLSLSIKSGAFGTSSTLLQEDYSALASQAAIATAPVPASDGAAAEFTLPASAFSSINRTGRTQLRISATTTIGLPANLLQLYGGEDGAQAPSLIIEH